MKTSHASLEVEFPVREKNNIYKKIFTKCKELRHKISAKNKNFNSVKAIRELRTEQ